MTEAIFPVFGVAFVVVVVLPFFALIAKVWLSVLERSRGIGPLHGLNVRYVLLTAPSVLPIAWLFSAGIHQAESGKSALACLFEHGAAALCFESGLFALALGLVVLNRSRGVLRGMRRVRPGRGLESSRVGARINAIIEAHPMLRPLRGRVAVSDDPNLAVATQGLATPKVVVGAAFAGHLSNDMLASALGHESEHVRMRDPLRYLVLQLALAVNPCGRFLLEPHARRWHAAREAHCDREAVLRGSLPLPLAQALVRAARPARPLAAALGTGDAEVLKFRVGMLLAFAEQSPRQSCNHGRSSSSWSFGLLLVTLFLPHLMGTAALDALHTGAESALTYFWF